MEEMRPLQTIEKESFQRLCEVMAGRPVKLPSVKTLKLDIESKYKYVK